MEVVGVFLNMRPKCWRMLTKRLPGQDLAQSTIKGRTNHVQLFPPVKPRQVVACVKSTDGKRPPTSILPTWAVECLYSSSSRPLLVRFWARHFGDIQRAIPIPAELAVDDGEAVPSDEVLPGRSRVWVPATLLLSLSHEAEKTPLAGSKVSQ